MVQARLYETILYYLSLPHARSPSDILLSEVFIYLPIVQIVNNPLQQSTLRYSAKILFLFVFKQVYITCSLAVGRQFFTAS